MVDPKETPNKVDPEAKGIVKHLFLGLIPTEFLLPYPTGTGGEEQEILEEVLTMLHDFAKKNFDPHTYPEKGKLPDKVLKGLFDLGLMGLRIPEQYGGPGFSMTSYCEVLKVIGEYDASVAATMGAHQGIGYKGLMLAGSEHLKKTYLPKLNESMVACYALTEPQAGSDVRALTTRAVKQEDGSFRITGQKLWITNGGFAEFATVFALEDMGDGKDKMSAFWVDLSSDGVTKGAEEQKLGLHHSSTIALFFDETPVPADHRIGEPGDGFRLAMDILNAGRLTLGAGCIGGITRMIELGSKWAEERKAFGYPLKDFQLIRRKLARMLMSRFVLESMVAVTARMADEGIEDYSLESAACKAYGSEMVWSAINDSMQIAGGAGYMSEYEWERSLRDARINQIFEGTNEIQRLHISLSGLKEPGDVLKDLASHGAMGMVEFVASRAKSYLARESFDGLHSGLEQEKEACELWTRTFHHAAEDLLKDHGRKILGKQYLLGRMADAAISLFAMVCVVSRMDHILRTEKDEKAKAEQMRIARAVFPRLWRRVENKLERLDGAGDERLDGIVDDLFGDD